METIFSSPGTSLSNSTAFSTSLTPGRCNGLSCAWAIASITFSGVRYAGMVDDGKANISQQAYEQQGLSEIKALEAVGLSADQPVVINNWSPGVAAARMCILQGTYFFDVKGAAGGHALGFRNEAGVGKRVYDIYDPNVGLYRTSDVDEFRTVLTGYFGNAFFATLRLKIRFFKVKRA